MMGIWEGGGAEETSTYSLIKVLYCKLPTIGKQPPTFPHKVQGLNCWPQRWEASVLPLHQYDPLFSLKYKYYT